jgi:hypothetical protein
VASSHFNPLAACLVFAAACHGGNPGPDAPGTCASNFNHDTPLQTPAHVDQGTVIDWPMNPPTSGTHYPQITAWATVYPFAVMRGNYLHNEEHGGIVMLYNCPEGCPDIVDAMTAFGQALPQDPQCEAPINARWIVTPDPLLPSDVRVAAAAWGWSLTMPCFDDTSMTHFFNEHYAAGGPDRTNCKPPTVEP